MADILIKNVPTNIHKKLKEMALYHHRSMTKEALAMLEEAAANYSVDAKPVPARKKIGKGEMAEHRRAQELVQPTPIPSFASMKREVPVPYKGIKPVSQKLMNLWKRDGMA